MFQGQNLGRQGLPYFLTDVKMPRMVGCDLCVEHENAIIPPAYARAIISSLITKMFNL